MTRRRLLRNEFTGNVATLLVGTTVAQAIPVAISPILTRLYTPDDLGVLALFIAITTVLGAVANGRYELAIMLPGDEDDALNVAALGLFIVVGVSLVLLVVVMLFQGDIAHLLGNPAIEPWLYLTPVTVLFMGTFNALNYLSTRHKQFGDVSRANMVKALAGAVTQVSVGLVTQGATGLITGQAVASAAANVRLARRTIHDRSRLRVINFRRMRTLGYVYRDFPKYSVWSALANTLSSNIASVLIGKFYSVATLGQYALVQRVLGLPVLLIGSSVGQVFFQAASESKRLTGSAKAVFLSTLAKLSVIAVPVFATLYFVAPSLFSVVFGPPWREAGEFARILLPLFAIRFVVVPLTLANQVNLRNRLGLIGNVALLTLTCAVIIGCGLGGVPISNTLGVLCVAQGLYYLGFLYAIYRHVAADPVLGQGSDE